MRIEHRILIEEIYDWIMSNQGMGLGESADAREEAENIVRSWLDKCDLL